MIGRNIDQLKGSLSVFVMHFVVIHIDVFRSIIDLVVLGDEDCTGVLTMESTGDGHLEVSESFLNPEELLAYKGEGDVFRLGGGSGDNAPPPRSPSYGGAYKLKDIS